MTITQLITQLRGEMAAKLEQRNKLAAELGELRDAEVQDEAKIAEVRKAKDALDAEIDTLSERSSELKVEQERDEAASRLTEQFTPGAVTPKYDEVARVGQEPRTYTRQKDVSGEARFFSDAWNAERGNRPAQERIQRHGAEVTVEGEMTERALATGGIAGLAVPQYLIELAAPVLRAARPIANVCNHHQLPTSGMSLIVPRETTGASTVAQATENSAVSSTDQVWTNLTVPVVTAAGQQQVSRQALERGESMDEIIFQDLARAYASQLDNYVVNGSGASGQPLGILNTSGIGAATAFGAVPGAANFSLKVAGAIYNVTSAGAGIYPKYLFMHPRRWAWLSGLVDGSNRPVVEVSQMGLFNALAEVLKAGQISADGPDFFNSALVVGTHTSGLPIVTDLNIPTNVGTNVEDIVIAADTDQLHLWEDGDGMPRQLSFEQTAGNNLTTTLVAYNYFAFTAGRYPGATAKVGGLDSTATFGLVNPSF